MAFKDCLEIKIYIHIPIFKINLLHSKWTDKHCQFMHKHLCEGNYSKYYIYDFWNPPNYSHLSRASKISNFVLSLKSLIFPHNTEGKILYIKIWLCVFCLHKCIRFVVVSKFLDILKCSLPSLKHLSSNLLRGMIICK